MLVCVPLREAARKNKIIRNVLVWSTEHARYINFFPESILLHAGCQITAHRMLNYCILMLNYCISDVSNHSGVAAGNSREIFEKNE